LGKRKKKNGPPEKERQQKFLQAAETRKKHNQGKIGSKLSGKMVAQKGRACTGLGRNSERLKRWKPKPAQQKAIRPL